MHGDMLKLVGPVSEKFMEGAHPAWRRLKRARANIKDPLKLLASVMRGWNARTHAGAYAAGERLLKASQRVFKDPEGRAKNMAAKRGARKDLALARGGARPTGMQVTRKRGATGKARQERRFGM